MVATPCGFESHHRHHVGASFISLAPTFFQKSERAHAAAPPFQITTAYAGLRFGFGCKPENCGIYTVAIFQLIVRSFCCSSLPNRTRCAGLRFGFGYKSENFVMYSAWIFRVAAKFALRPRLFCHRHKPALFHPLLSKLIPYCYRYLVDICSPACYNWFTKVDRREGEQWSIPH